MWVRLFESFLFSLYEQERAVGIVAFEAYLYCVAMVDDGQCSKVSVVIFMFEIVGGICRILVDRLGNCLHYRRIVCDSHSAEKIAVAFMDGNGHVLFIAESSVKKLLYGEIGSFG